MNLQSFESILSKEELRIWFSAEWTDSASIRLGVKNNEEILSYAGGIDRIQLASSPPIIKGKGGISLSHSKLGGVVIISSALSGVGVDLEETSRLTDRIIKRVSTEDERTSAPNPLFLWPAKEATFKALYPNNENVIIAELAIRDWEQIGPQIWSYFVQHNEKSIKGFLFNGDFLLVAASKLRL